eukprot:2467249-Amphidinium_carterae.1
MPHEAVQALQKSVVWFPMGAWNPLLLENLGSAYASLGDATKQRDYLARALRLTEVVQIFLSQEHPEVAQTLANLGNAYGNARDYQKSARE